MADIGRTLGVISELTIVSVVRPDQVEPCRQVLATFHPQAIFQAVPMVHFARFVLLHPGDPTTGQTSLFFNSHYDGSLDAYLAALATGIPEQWNTIWSHCDNWPGTTTLPGLTEFVQHNAVTTNLLYASYPSATLRDVQRALRVDQAVQDLLDQVPALRRLPPDQLSPADKAVQELVAAFDA